MKAFIATFLGCLVLSGTAYAKDTKTGYLTGQLQAKTGEPLAGGLIFFFNELAGTPPAPDKYWRVPDEMGFLDGKGNFKVRLSEGKYFIGAIKRSSGRDPGPPLEGDLFLIDRDAAGTPKLHPVNKDVTTDIGTIAGAAPFRNEMSRAQKGTTAIEGTVTDTEGKPIAGALVFAFATPGTVDKPLFVSERSGKEGKYLLRVADNGSYYLKVRDVYGGGAPSVGAVIGGYGDDSPIPVKTIKGTIVGGIDIKTRKFAGKGQK